MANGRILAGASGHSLAILTIGSAKNVHQALPTVWTLLSMTDMFTVDTNPCSRYSPFVSSVFPNLTPDLHLIDNNDSSDCSEECDVHVSPVDPTADEDNPETTTTADANGTPICPPCTPTKPAPSGPDVRAPRLPCSWVSIHPTNLAPQLESELWAACLGQCGEDQLITLAN